MHWMDSSCSFSLWILIWPFWLCPHNTMNLWEVRKSIRILQMVFSEKKKKKKLTSGATLWLSRTRTRDGISTEIQSQAAEGHILYCFWTDMIKRDKVVQHITENRGFLFPPCSTVHFSHWFQKEQVEKKK